MLFLLFITTVATVFAADADIKPDVEHKVKEELKPVGSVHVENTDDLYNDAFESMKQGRQLFQPNRQHILGARYHDENTQHSPPHGIDDHGYVNSQTNYPMSHHDHRDIQSRDRVAELLWQTHNPSHDHRYLKSRGPILLRPIHMQRHKEYSNDIHLGHLRNSHLSDRLRYNYNYNGHRGHDHTPNLRHYGRRHYGSHCGCDDGNMPQYHRHRHDLRYHGLHAEDNGNHHDTHVHQDLHHRYHNQAHEHHLNTHRSNQGHDHRIINHDRTGYNRDENPRYSQDYGNPTHGQNMDQERNYRGHNIHQYGYKNIVPDSRHQSHDLVYNNNDGPNYRPDANGREYGNRAYGTDIKELQHQVPVNKQLKADHASKEKKQIPEEGQANETVIA